MQSFGCVGGSQLVLQHGGGLYAKVNYKHWYLGTEVPIDRKYSFLPVCILSLVILVAIS
jgi:hypothetical protein